jgi:hypothetical protein
MTRPVPDRIVLQRMRNRIIESLELASSHEVQSEYQRKVPLVDVAAEVFNQWEDWVPKDWRRHYMAGDVFTSAEIAAIAAFEIVWDEIASELPELPLAALMPMPGWQRLADAAAASLRIFLERGRLPEDSEG